MFCLPDERGDQEASWEVVEFFLRIISHSCIVITSLINLTYLVIYFLQNRRRGRSKRSAVDAFLEAIKGKSEEERGERE